MHMREQKFPILKIKITPSVTIRKLDKIKQSKANWIAITTRGVDKSKFPLSLNLIYTQLKDLEKFPKTETHTILIPR